MYHLLFRDNPTNWKSLLSMEIVSSKKIMQATSKDEISMDGFIDYPFAPIRTYQDIAGMCRNIWSRPQKADQKYRD